MQKIFRRALSYFAVDRGENPGVLLSYYYYLNVEAHPFPLYRNAPLSLIESIIYVLPLGINNQPQPNLFNKP